MADYEIPWGSVTGETREITTDDRQGGFQCGALDMPLFNKLFQQIQGEIGAVAVGAGVDQTDATDNVLYTAILALIAAATGGDDTSNYVLMTQARARLPIWPEVLTTSHDFNVTTPSTGQVRIPAGKSFLHRGIFTITSAQTDFATSASKTYHLRWNPTDGFNINDLSNGGYNPSSLDEGNPAFDSTYDDMLIARVTTSSGNVCTITNLANTQSLKVMDVWRDRMDEALDWTGMSGSGLTLGWARTPVIASIVLSEWRSSLVGPNGEPTTNGQGSCRAIGVRMAPAGATRYAIPPFQYYYEDSMRNQGAASVVRTAIAA